MALIFRLFDAAKDLQKYVQLYNKVNNYHPLFQKATAESVKELILNDPSYRCEFHFVAYDGDSLVGEARGLSDPYYNRRTIADRKKPQTTGLIFFSILNPYLRIMGTRLLDSVCSALKKTNHEVVHTLPIIENRDIWKFLEYNGFVMMNRGYVLRYKIPKKQIQMQLPAGLRERCLGNNDKQRLISFMFQMLKPEMKEFRFKKFMWDAERNGFFIIENEEGKRMAFVKNIICENKLPFIALIVPISMEFLSESGVGTYLIKRSIEWARLRGKKVIHASAGVKGPSLDMYKEIGFERVANVRLYGKILK